MVFGFGLILKMPLPSQKKGEWQQSTPQSLTKPYFSEDLKAQKTSVKLLSSNEALTN